MRRGAGENFRLTPLAAFVYDGARLHPGLK
jgi:hypothetical protein